ncbi:Uncharacterised protein [Bordetella pertussis]|nr:Uncharacterised protein [Bordetella pertussis]
MRHAFRGGHAVVREDLQYGFVEVHVMPCPGQFSASAVSSRLP